MPTNEQPEKAPDDRDERHDASRKRDTSQDDGHVDETDEPVEADAVDAVTPINEPG